jgi:uncharacterized protein YbjT (DUF2867 family)
MKTILVIGDDVENVVGCLIGRGEFAVRALTRQPDSEAAQKLRRLGAEIVSGHLGDRASLRAALRGAWGVLAVTSDECHGRNVINAVAGGEVEHFVFGSRVAAEQLEAYVKSLGLPATFVPSCDCDLATFAAEAFAVS